MNWRQKHWACCSTRAITATFPEAKGTEIYCMADDFCREFAEVRENIGLTPEDPCAIGGEDKNP